MDCINFSETKSERKYYEDKKQKALRYLDHTLELFPKLCKNPTHFRAKLEELRKRVNDI